MKNAHIIKGLVGTAAVAGGLWWLTTTDNTDAVTFIVIFGVIALALGVVKLLNKATQK